ncbi:MAG: tRNA (adenine-N1)-methyltransferase [Anaerolineae bacterium]
MDIESPHLARAGDRVLIIAGDHKRYLVRLQPGAQFHTHLGIIAHDDLIGRDLGREVQSHLGHRFVVVRPSIHDLLMRVKRRSQIIYPKEIGMILLKLDLTDGRRVVEAGTGSGALTTAMAWAVQPSGHVYSFDIREDMLAAARGNLQANDLAQYVSLQQADATQPLPVTNADAMFLDVREPQNCLQSACDVLAPGGFYGALVPTTNQVAALLDGMARHPLTDIEVLEIMLRGYKPVPGRLRPQDRMVAHTGYLIFARKIIALPETGQGQETTEAISL